jgi:lipopolysaccharide export system permease protein
MFTIFDRYVLKLMGAATLVTAIILTFIILLTQSLRYLELVIGTDASATYFMAMTGLAVPKFLEVILPIAFLIGCAYQANKMILDREIIVMRASGVPVLKFARGFLYFTGLMVIAQFFLSGWLAPLAINQLQQTRDDVKSHYATLMFREGVFNDLGNGMTAFVEERTGLNELIHLVIHDEEGFIEKDRITTIIAQRGIVNVTEDQQQILIYNGTQYQKTASNQTVSRLDFDQYILDIPVSQNTMSQRWQEPDERTFDQLFLSESKSSQRDLRKASEFWAEIHRRVTTPILYCVFAALIMIFLFMGEWRREGLSTPMLKLSASVVFIQVLHIIFFNMAQNSVWMNIMLYAVVLIPLAFAYFKFKRYYSP